MSGRRDPEKRLLAQLKRVERERDAARLLVERKTRVILELNEWALRHVLRDVLHEFDDLERHIGIANLIDADDRIRWRELDERVAALRHERPHLFVSDRAPGGGAS